ncbi:hypothetical protein RAS1_36490 [Phycisphaerae bacterium RAS1]|nr:hypothetical protein RAS1_36490 [Phycisphaerae bacterium RAS1]
MHRFQFFQSEGRQPLTELAGAHVVGADGVPVRAEFSLADGEVRCESRSQEPAGLSLLWPVSGFGTLQLETTRLPARPAPYHLHVELTRHRLLRLNLKREEWGLFDYRGMEEIGEQIDHARQRFIEALQKLSSPEQAARIADEALREAMWASERMARFHASVFLGRRQQSGGFARGYFGASLPGGPVNAALVKAARSLIDFVRVPLTWRDIQPKEQGSQYDSVDACLKACSSVKMPVRSGPLLNFGVQFLPDWIYIWENDFEEVFDFARDHIRRTVERYGNSITHWTVASGLHADNALSFNFEQIMELTRMAATVTRQAAPRSQILVDLTQPWGEYYARNQRSIPPLLYADMLVQSGVPFDAFGLQFVFGIDYDGYHFRDLLQISALIDRIANLGKPLHVTAIAAPSAAPEGKPVPIGTGGQWHESWTEKSQADWLVALCEIALSKPYVETICLQTIADGRDSGVPFSGVLREDLSPKQAYNRLLEMRKQLQAEPPK